jgi:hypothetical protein
MKHLILILMTLSANAETLGTVQIDYKHSTWFGNQCKLLAMQQTMIRPAVMMKTDDYFIKCKTTPPRSAIDSASSTISFVNDKIFVCPVQDFGFNGSGFYIKINCTNEPDIPF